MRLHEITKGMEVSRKYLWVQNKTCKVKHWEGLYSTLYMRIDNLMYRKESTEPSGNIRLLGDQLIWL